MGLASGLQAVVGLLVLSVVASSGAEVHSNGLGGGKWSDPGSWRGRTVPGSNDVVAVAGDDHIVVDLVDTNRVSCRELHIDPRGMLSFQKGGPRTVLIVAGPVESYGAIRMDLGRFDDGAAELRLVATNAPGRYIRLQRGGSMVVNGRRDLPEGERNAWLVSAPPAGDVQGHLRAADQTALELQGAGFRNVRVYAASLDNTGGSAGERCNVIGCFFTGPGGLALDSCDSAVVADNEFVRGSDWAIEAWHCVLTEIRSNRVRNWRFGMSMERSRDNWFTSNTIENVHFAFRHQGPAMLQGNVIRNAVSGFELGHGDGVWAADCVASNCVTAAYFAHGSGQLINFQVQDPPTNGVALTVWRSSATLLNCPITTNQVRMSEQARTNWWIQSQQYLVVQVKGAVPAGSQVRVRTAAPAKPIPPGALDPNVRSSPAPIGPGGFTPLPQTQAALVVNSWGFDAAGKYLPPPAYVLEVVGPAPGPEKPPPVLNTVTVTPADAWYRPRPNEPAPTVEVTVP